LVYEAGKSSSICGGLVLKAVEGKFVPVGLHRGGLNGDYSCGTKISDILSGKNNIGM